MKNILFLFFEYRNITRIHTLEATNDDDDDESGKGQKMNWMNLNKKRRVCRKSLSGFATVQTEEKRCKINDFVRVVGDVVVVFVVVVVVAFVIIAAVSETWEAMLLRYLLHSLFLSSIHS